MTSADHLDLAAAGFMDIEKLLREDRQQNGPVLSEAVCGRGSEDGIDMPGGETCHSTNCGSENCGGGAEAGENCGGGGSCKNPCDCDDTCDCEKPCNCEDCEKPCPDEENCLCVCRLICSIAQVEAALAHILNAEGEKLQKAVEKACSVKDLLAINKSVQQTLAQAVLLEQTLYLKLVEAKEPDSD